MAEPNLFKKQFPENEDQFRAFMDSSPIFAWAKDEHGRYVYLNKTYERIFGARVREWQGKTDFDIWSVESAELFWRNDLQVLDEQRIVNGVETLATADGGQSYLVCKFPFHDTAGNAFVGGVGIDISEQKRLEAELRSSEQRFQTLSDLAIEAVVIHDGNHIVDANASAPRLFGYERAEFLSGFPSRFLAPEALAAVWKRSQERDDRPYESMGLRKDGSRVPIEITSRLINPTDSSLWVTIVRDLTERKRAEQTIQDSQERLRLAQEAFGIGHFDWDLHTGEMTWSESLKRIMRGDLDSKTTLLDKLKWVHPDDQPAFRAQLEEAVTGKSSRVSVTYRSTRADGEPGWRICEASVHADGTGKPARIIGVIADITPHKRAEEAQRIEHERKRLESVILSLTEAVILLAPDGKVVSMNPAALQMHEFAAADTTPQTLLQFAELFEAATVDGSPVLLEEWPGSRALRGEVVVGLELRATNRRTGRTWVALYGGAPTFDEAGAIIMAVVSIHDVTAERLASEETRRANAALHALSGRLLRLQDEERKRIARELHDGTLQVITAMSMNLLTIARSPSIMGAQETRDLIAEAQELARRASRELRTLSYLLHPPDLDELGLVAALRSWADGFAHRAGMTLDLTLDDPGRLEPDAETALFRIAQEALGNVQRHSGSKAAELRLVVAAGEIQLEVRDAGRGVPPTVLTRNPGRIGVGIMGMRERARQLGGTLEIFSDQSGTTVRATFPRKAPR